jgi:biopolymer transport protein ExbD
MEEKPMKLMNCRILIAVVAIGLGADGLAAEKTDLARVSFSLPSQSKNPTPPGEVVFLVVEGATLSHDASPVPEADVVNYVNKLLEIKKASYIGVYSREGAKYGDVIKAIDALRGTNAKNISVSMVELARGRQP